MLPGDGLRVGCGAPLHRPGALEVTLGFPAARGRAGVLGLAVESRCTGRGRALEAGLWGPAAPGGAGALGWNVGFPAARGRAAWGGCEVPLHWAGLEPRAAEFVVRCCLERAAWGGCEAHLLAAALVEEAAGTHSVVRGRPRLLLLSSYAGPSPPAAMNASRLAGSILKLAPMRTKRSSPREQSVWTVEGDTASRSATSRTSRSRPAVDGPCSTGAAKGLEESVTGWDGWTERAPGALEVSRGCEGLLTSGLDPHPLWERVGVRVVRP